MKERTNEAWQLEFSAGDGASGQTVAATLERVADAAACGWVAMFDLEGGGDALPELRARERCVTRVEDLVPLVRGVDHLEWADFFLCDTVASASAIRGAGSYTPDLRRCIVLLRVVELASPDFIAYGRSLRVSSALLKLYPLAELRRATLETLDFPR